MQRARTILTAATALLLASGAHADAKLFGGRVGVHS
jgi:hypothetical protein